MKNWRINLIFVINLIFGAAIVIRLFSLQVLNHELYSALAKGQQPFLNEEISKRGEIFVQDRNDNTYGVAVNKEWPLVYISPRENIMTAEEQNHSSEELGKILNIDKSVILEKFAKNNLYEVIKTKITNEEFNKVNDLNLKGVYIGKEDGRFYPQGSFLSQVIGFLGGEGSGQYGLEEYWDDALKGSNESAGAEPALDESPKGSDLVLTIDYNVQYQAEKLLNKAGKEFKIEGGEIIVMDPDTGKIVAMANFPNFDPNQYVDYANKNLDIFQNSAIQKFFEPGSGFKSITMAAALNEGKIDPLTTYVDTGQAKIGGSTIYNYDRRKWGEMTMTGVLEKSINTGAVFAESKLSHNVFLDYINRFGVFEETGIDLPGEISSQNSSLKNGSEINFATASFGQGIEMTSMQFVRAYAAIANGGRLVKPYLVEKILKSGGQQETIQPQIGEAGIISSETSSRLSAMLVSVVENGYAKQARVPGYYIAGKTGTAQIPWTNLGINKAGYSEKTYQSFIGFFPAFNPKFVVLVKFFNPQTNTAEYSAVPIFQELAKYIIDYYQIPPDHE